MDNQQLLDDDQPLLGDSQHARAGKKIYRRPNVQVYGTLSQITQAVPNVAGHALDPLNPGPGSPNGQQQNQRT